MSTNEHESNCSAENLGFLASFCEVALPNSPIFGAPCNKRGRISAEQNQTHSYLNSFVWIRVHSWMERLSFSSLALLASWRFPPWRKSDATRCNGQIQNLQNEPSTTHQAQPLCRRVEFWQNGGGLRTIQGQV